jgi:anti-sigma factor RsiW
MSQMTRIDDVMLMAYVDGEVDAQTAREIESALLLDPALGRRVALFRQTASLTRGAFTEVLHEPVPDRLSSVIRGARVTPPSPAAPGPQAAAESPVDTTNVIAFDKRSAQAANPARGGVLRTAAWAAAAAISAVALFAAGTQSGWVHLVDPPQQQLASSADSERWVDNLTAWYRVHLSSYQKEQRLLVDVGAENIGELEKWVGTKLQRQISLPDLAQFGYRQQGGRLLLIGGQPAAQFFYEDDNRELVQLVVGVTDQPDRGGRLDKRDDINVVSWREKGYAYAFIGRIDGQRLWLMADVTWAKLKPI